MKKFTGTGVAIVTPFKNDSSIDFKSLGKLVEHLITNNADYLVVLGTTGEAVTQTKDEKRAVIDCVIETNNNKLPVVVGMGGYNTREVVNNIRENSFENIDGILSVAPYYNKPNQSGLYQHYKTIAAASPVPVIIYNVPGRTGVNIHWETTLKLAHEVKNIVAIKEASGDLCQITKIIKDKPEDFLVISGDDALTLPIIAIGGKGVISVLANAFPKEWSEMVKYALDGNYQAARKIHNRFTDLIDELFIDGNPAGIKATLNVLNIVQNTLRLPLSPVSNSTRTRITKLVNEFIKVPQE
jgi:4-hydroxy-tetrahydrodipicolinate synthase